MIVAPAFDEFLDLLVDRRIPGGRLDDRDRGSRFRVVGWNIVCLHGPTVKHASPFATRTPRAGAGRAGTGAKTGLTDEKAYSSFQID